MPAWMQTLARRTTLVAVAALCLASCGDPLVTGDYKGEVLAQIEGRLLIRSAARTPDTLSVAIFWMSPHTDQAWTLAEQPIVSQGLALSRYQLRIYQPPPDIVLRDHAEAGRFSLATIMLYDDSNENGAWDVEQELLVGGASQYALLYTPSGLDAQAFGEALGPGYHIMRLAGGDQQCRDGPGLARMTRVAEEPAVNLVVFGDLGSLLPNLDCDDYVADWCEEILTDALARDIQSPSEKTRVAQEFITCLKRAGAAPPCFEELPAAVLFGDEVREEELASYNTCISQHTPDRPYGPEDECNFFLQETRWATTDEQVQELYTLYEQCTQDYKL